MNYSGSIIDLNSVLEKFSSLDGLEIIEAAYNEFGDKFAVVSSFGTESSVLLHLTASIDKHLPILFVDTGKLFKETYIYKELLTEKLGLTNVKTVSPDFSEISLNDPDESLWKEQPDDCCFIRKVKPLGESLTAFVCWATGRKSFHGSSRSDLKNCEIDGQWLKINPLATWSYDEVQNYFENYNLPYHPLSLNGYSSVGCVSCTSENFNKNMPRAGRWPGKNKTECGIHVQGMLKG